MSRDEKTRLSFWYPLIQAAGLPTPRTIIIRNEPDDLGAMFDSKPSQSLDSLVEEITVASRALGVPFFLRTDFTSAKHQWKDTCYVSDPASLRDHIYEIAEFSACADILGLPTDVWVVRELLKTKPLFYAFSGRMPITREFRFFVRDGVVIHEQPYWPIAALDGQVSSQLESAELHWTHLLVAASRLSHSEREHLTGLSLAANAAVPGFWSVDWLQDVDGKWFLTDMAEGEKSYRWSPDAA